MKRVLDSYALLAFLEKEPGFEQVESLLIRASEKNELLLMSVVNWGEVYYIFLRELGERKAEAMERLIQALPIEIIDADRALAKEAARFKAFKKISYADCFAAALAKVAHAELITGDPEFRSLENEIKIIWI